MNAPREPEALVRRLAEERVPPEEPAVIAQRRERMISSVSMMIRESHATRERRLRVRRWFMLAAAAAVLGLTAGASHHVFKRPVATTAAHQSERAHVAAVRSVQGTVVVKHAGHGRVVTTEDLPALRSGDELETAADGFAFLQTERSAIRVQPATQMSVFPPSVAEERIRLALGRIDLEVSKQPHSTRSVVVETPDAEVIVRGTEFAVIVAPEGGQSVTRVRVTEGAVWVLHDKERELVSMGEEWASNGEARRAPVMPPSPVVANESAGPTLLRSTPRSKSGAPRAVSRALTEENRMYQAALEARNRGDERKAVELFGQVLTRYPNGHLAEVAQVERMRGFKKLGDSGAAQAVARRYLAQHPNGAVRDEARSVVLGEK